LDGIHLCQAWLAHQGAPALCVVSETACADVEVAAIVAECVARQAVCLLLPDALFGPLSQVDNGVALLFLVDIPRRERINTLTQSAVLLDQLQDPGNLGSILRSAAAAGIKHVFCSAGSVAAWSPKVLRAGMGAHFVLEIVENADLHALVGSATIPVLATSSHADSTVFAADLTQSLAWLFGHEGQGVSTSLLAMATQQVAIPHAGEIESLNVAASAAVCLFEQMRQRLQH
jgi:TrmH family RNA methyltransferase